MSEEYPSVRAQLLTSSVLTSGGVVYDLPAFGLLDPVSYAKTSGDSNFSVNSSTGVISAAAGFDGEVQSVVGTATGHDGCVIPWTAELTGLINTPLLSIDHFAKTATVTNPHAAVTYTLYTRDASGTETSFATPNSGNSYTVDISGTTGKDIICHATKTGFTSAASDRYILRAQNSNFYRDFSTMGNDTLANLDGAAWASTGNFSVASGVLKSTASTSAQRNLTSGVTKAGVKFTKTITGEDFQDRLQFFIMCDAIGANALELQIYSAAFLIKAGRTGMTTINTGSIKWKSPAGGDIYIANGAVIELQLVQSGPTSWQVQMYCNGIPQIAGAGFDISDFMAAIPGTKVFIYKGSNGASPPNNMLTKFEILDYTSIPISLTTTSYVPAVGAVLPKVKFSGYYPGSMTSIDAAVRDASGKVLTPWTNFAVSGNSFTDLQMDLPSLAQGVANAMLVVRDHAAPTTFWEKPIGNTPVGHAYQQPEIGTNMPFNEILDVYRQPSMRWSWQTNTIGRGDYNNGVNPPGYDFSGSTLASTWEPTSAIDQTTGGAALKFPSTNYLYCLMSPLTAGNDLPTARGGTYELRFVDPANRTPSGTATNISWTSVQIPGCSMLAPVNGVGEVTLPGNYPKWKFWIKVTGTMPTHGRGIVPMLTKVGDSSTDMSTDQFQSDVQGCTTANGPIRFMTSRYVNKSKVIPMNDPKAMLSAANRWKGGHVGPVPIENGIAIANECERPLYWNLPHHDSDEHIETELTIARDTLNKKLYVEWSNETWNKGFSQYAEIGYLGCVAGLHNTAGDAGVNTSIYYAANYNGLVADTTGEILKSGGFLENDLVFAQLNGVGFLLYKAKSNRAQGTFLPMTGLSDANWELIASHNQTERAGKRYKAQRNIRIREIAQSVYGEDMAERFELVTGGWAGVPSYNIDELSWQNSWQAVDQVMIAPYWYAVSGNDLGRYGSAHITGWGATEKALYADADLAPFATAFFSVAPTAVEQTVTSAVSYADTLEALLRAVPGYVRDKVKTGIYECGHHVAFSGYPDPAKARIAYDYLQAHSSMATMYETYLSGLASRLGGTICVFDLGAPTAVDYGQSTPQRWGILRKTGDTSFPMYAGTAAAVAAL